MRRIVLILIGLGALAALYFGLARRNAPPEVPFTRATRETIVSALTTNGKVEPIDWVSARAETAGVVRRILVHRGQRVRAGAPLVELSAASLPSEIAAAQARVEQAQAELETLRAGGRSSEIASLDTALNTARQELESARRDFQTAQRLQAKNAATGQEVTAARDRVERAQLQIQSLEQRRTALVSQSEKTAAEARLREAQASVGGSRQRLAMTVVRAPTAGTVYQFDLRPGAYLNAGDIVANIGKLETVRVIVYVDEPDLGRVQTGLPVTITWDAMQGRKWTGTVERMPSQVITLGTRQVGEVSCVIGNPGLDLLPGTNVNAEIVSRVVQSAVTIPNSTLRREGGKTGVFVLKDGMLEWREVKLGVASVVRSEVLGGVAEGDSIALPTDRTLKPGMTATAVYQ